MIKTVVKTLLFAAAVLLLGQVRWSDSTLAERFHGLVASSLRRGGEALRRYPLIAKVTRSAAPADSAHRAQGDTARVETLTEADRESLRRLLQ